MTMQRLVKITTDYYSKELLERCKPYFLFEKFGLYKTPFIPVELSFAKRVRWWLFENVWWRFARYRPDYED